MTRTSPSNIEAFRAAAWQAPNCNPVSASRPWTGGQEIIAIRAGVPRLSTLTLRHLCLTDLARAGWELHAIAAFAGHRSPDTTLQYIHLSGRDLAARLAEGMAQVHAWRLTQVADVFGVPS